MSLVTFDRDDQFRGQSVVDVWIEIEGKNPSDGTAQTFKMAQRVLTYPAGASVTPVTDDRLGQIAAPTRELSDGRRGQMRGVSCPIVLHDWDNFLRAWLENDYQEAVHGLPITAWLAPEDQRVAGGDAAIYFRGVIRDAEFRAPRLVQLNCEDPFSSNFGDPVPFYTVSRVTWPSAPVGNVGVTVSPIYGRHSDEPSATSPPVIANETARGGSGPDGGFYVAGFGDLGGLAVSSLTPSEDVGAGALVAGTFYFMRTTVKDGVESDPYPFYSGVTIAVADGSAITVDGEDLGSAVDAYRTYIGQDGYRWQYYLQHTATTVQFTDFGDTVTAGAVIQPSRIYEYIYWANMPDGRTAITIPPGFSGVTTPNAVMHVYQGLLRPVRFALTPIAGAISYGAARRDTTGDFYLAFEAAPDQVNGDGDVYIEDHLEIGAGSPIAGIVPDRGVVPGVYVGTRSALDGTVLYWFLFAHGAIKEIQSAYLDDAKVDAGDFGTTVFLPGKTGYDLISPNPYVDIDGIRFTAGALALDPDDPATATLVATPNVFRINVAAGVEDVGDASGDAITSIYDQLVHVFENFTGTRTPYVGGAWNGPQTFSDSTRIVDVAAVATAQARANFLITAGEDASWYYREAVSRQQLHAEFNLSGAIDSAWAVNGALTVACWYAYEPGTRRFTETHDFVADSLSFKDDRTELENDTKFQFAWSYTGSGADFSTSGYTATGFATHQPSIAKYGRVTLPGTELVTFRLRDRASICQQLADLRLERFGYPLRTAPVDVAGFHASTCVLGEQVAFDHSEGSGVTGWSNRPMRVQAMTLDAEGHRVGLVVEDYRTAQRLAAGRLRTLPPEEECTVIFEEAWAAGQSNASMKTDGSVFSVPGGDSVDPTYPNLAYTENVKVTAGVGPAGENVIEPWQVSGSPDAGVSAAYEELFGAIGIGHWDARSIEFKADYYLDSTIMSAASADSPLLMVFARHDTSGADTPFGSLNRAIELAIWQDTGDTWVMELKAQCWNNSDIDVQSYTFSKAAVENQWHTFKLLWKTGTINDYGTDDVSTDGFIQAYWGDTLIYDEQSIDLKTTYGGGDETYANTGRGIGVGFFGLAGKVTNIHLCVPAA